MNSPHTTVCVKVLPRDVARFYPLLQTGFFLRCQVGVPLASFLKETVNLSQAYIDDRISTVFLDGKPVDDIEAAVILDGCTVALSSAMPGLVGATMRRKGFYATFRSTITYASTGRGIASGAGSVRLKLFNLVMREVGPDLLKKGIFLQSADLKEFFSRQEDTFFVRVLGARIDGHFIDPIRLKKEGTTIGAGLVELKTCMSE